MESAAAGYITDVDYIPGFYSHMAPVAMRYVASLNQVIPPTASKGFRYLELGCGLGRSLTTIAAANPHGQFVGVDINENHIALMKQEISLGELLNVQAISSDFSGLNADLGKFDYIAVHGVFSWVSPDVRESLISAVRNYLAPGGLLLVSYNAMPGWAHLQPIRGILRQYSQLRHGDSVQRIQDALNYLVFIRDKKAQYFEDNPRAAAYVDSLLKQDIRYLAHEYLNEHWTSFYFSEVAGMFGAAGLSYVGSLPVYTNFWDLCVRPEFQELFRTTKDRLVTESHKDFCANTAFRWDVYASHPRVMSSNRDRLKMVDGLYFRASRPGIVLPQRVNLGVVTSTVQGPAYEAVVKLLSEKCLTLEEIVHEKCIHGNAVEDVMRVVDACVAMGLVDVVCGAIPSSDLAGNGDDVFVPSAFNRAVIEKDALCGRPVALASQLSGTGHAMGDFDVAILHELTCGGADGLSGRVAARLSQSGRSLQRDGRMVTDQAERLHAIEAACRVFRADSIPLLRELGIVADRA